MITVIKRSLEKALKGSSSETLGTMYVGALSFFLIVVFGLELCDNQMHSYRKVDLLKLYDGGEVKRMV